MSDLKSIYIKIKPIIHTYVFELKKHWKKFVVLSLISVSIVFLLSYLPYALIPDNPMPETQAEYFKDELGLFNLLIIFAVCFFFSDIICSEFSKKTGFVVFPKINKSKLLIGKYLGNLTLIYGIAAVYYIILGILGYHFYPEPIVDRYFFSFVIVIIYILSITGFVTFFSSFMKNVNLTIVSTILILMMVFQIVDRFIVLYNPDIEPLYSLNYLKELIGSVLLEDFPETRSERYIDREFRDFTFRTWITPPIDVGIIIMLLYAIICLSLATIISQRKQL